MDHSFNSSIRLVRYDQVYLNTISPQLKALDLFMKENTPPFNMDELANLLEIEVDEIQRFMTIHHLSSLDTTSLFSLILHSNSELSGYMRRQWKYFNTTQYTPEMISEIYKLNLHKVQSAFNDLEAAFVTHDQLIEVFKRIHVTQFL